MHQPNHRLVPRIGKSLLPILICHFFHPFLVWSQMDAGAGARGRYVQIDVSIRNSSGEVLDAPADVKLYLNGIPCGEGSTTNGRVSFTMSNLGNFTVVVGAAGYKSAQDEIIVSEPVRVQLQISLQRESGSKTELAPAQGPILTPKAKQALDKAIEALRNDKLTEAEKALNQIIKLAPNNPHVLYTQGLFELKNHEWTKAQSALEKATQMEPNSARAFAALGMALCNQKKYAEAIAPLEKSVALDPTTGWETRWSLAESYYQTKRFEEALKTSEQAEAESNGQVVQVDLLVARALTAVGRYEDSAKVLREILKNHSESTEAVPARRFLDRLTADRKIAPQ